MQILESVGDKVMAALNFASGLIDAAKEEALRDVAAVKAVAEEALAEVEKAQVAYDAVKDVVCC